MPSGSAAFFYYLALGSIARSHRNSFISGEETRISEWKTLKVLKRLLCSSCSSFTMLCQWMSFLIWVALVFFEIDKQKSLIHIFTETTKGIISNNTLFDNDNNMQLYKHFAFNKCKCECESGSHWTWGCVGIWGWAVQHPVQAWHSESWSCIV